ncbi:hypothetical protein [Pseudomonas nitroreducens]|uniref:hypothetical protein n=1 Tax=Pseudomonas nitroreducens TaxID=46680 RepID=UPI00209F5C65|nr:hypothetical protein [Pseudomonas nitroreducens]MCP1621742.1 hypothetical protein [Pseudomonas nitroreducens]
MPRRALLPRLLASFASLFALGAHASGQLPIPFPGEAPARCAWSANVLACMDDSGNLYSVATLGRDTYLRGFEARSGRHWAQTGTRYGSLTFFSGVTSDGQVWVGTSRGIGWTNISRFSSSSGDSARLTCGRVSGCKQQER